MSDEQQRKIYQTDGDRYEALIAREDYQSNILKAIEEIINPDDLDILDLGAGTGRLTLLLASRAKSIRAFDISSEMLRVWRIGRISGPMLAAEPVEASCNRGADGRARAMIRAEPLPAVVVRPMNLRI